MYPNRNTPDGKGRRHGDKKIVDGPKSLYKTDGKETATIIFQEETSMQLDHTAPDLQLCTCL